MELVNLRFSAAGFFFSWIVLMRTDAMHKPTYFYVGDCRPHYFTTCQIAYWLWRIVPFGLLVIGTFGNILNIIVLSRKQLRKYSTATFLLVLAVTELTVLWTSLVPDTMFSILGRRLEDQSPVTCRLRFWLAFTSGAFSTWILVLLTIERTLLTKAPVFSKTKLTPRNAFVSSLAVLFVIATLNSHLMFGIRLYDIKDNDNLGQNDTQPQPLFRCYFSSEEYGNFYSYYWHVIVLVIFNLVPASIIIFGNINIAVVHLLLRKKLTMINARRRSAAKIVFILSLFYVLTTTPWCICNILREKFTEHSEESFANWQLATAVVTILLWCNFTFNFFFYFVSGTLFKNEWKRLVNNIKDRFLPKPMQTTSRARS